MTTVLLATASDSVFRAMDSVIGDETTSLIRVKNGIDVVEVIGSHDPDLVLLDLQIGNMGGVATCIAIRQEEGYDRLERRPVGLILDRDADVFIANEGGADDFVIKPLNPLKVKALIERLLDSTVDAAV